MKDIYRVIAMRQAPGIIASGTNGSSARELYHSLYSGIDETYQLIGAQLGQRNARQNDVIVPVIGGQGGYLRFEKADTQHGTSDIEGRDYPGRVLVITRPAMRVFWNTPCAYEERDAFLEYAHRHY